MPTLQLALGSMAAGARTPNTRAGQPQRKEYLRGDVRLNSAERTYGASEAEHHRQLPSSQRVALRRVPE